MNSSVDSTILIEAGSIPKRSEGVFIFSQRKTSQVEACFLLPEFISFILSTHSQCRVHNTIDRLQKMFSQTHTQTHINTLSSGWDLSRAKTPGLTQYAACSSACALKRQKNDTTNTPSIDSLHSVVFSSVRSSVVRETGSSLPSHVPV